ncbi:MAG: polysaccharide deacetylase [Candidatus Kaiserbacteria bacterium]|nr:polysaccharide deacetylase [Candidatus Kaiserbacteria bacterium]
MQLLIHILSSLIAVIGLVPQQAQAVTAITTTQATSSYYVTDAGIKGLEDAPIVSLDDATSTMSIANGTKMVALTFDDGPRASSTEKVLHILNAEHVPGTFFLIGENVAQNPALTREIVTDGNVIGIHTYNHPKNLPWMDPAERDWELSATQAVIASTTGVHTSLFRPPYGIMTPQLKSILEGQGYTVYMWNVDPRDWDYRRSTSDSIIQNVLSHLKNHMVILFHDGRDSTGIHNNLEGALPTVIAELKARGYTFVTVDKI